MALRLFHILILAPNKFKVVNRRLINHNHLQCLPSGNSPWKPPSSLPNSSVRSREKIIIFAARFRNMNFQGSRKIDFFPDRSKNMNFKWQCLPINKPVRASRNSISPCAGIAICDLVTRSVFFLGLNKDTFDKICDLDKKWMILWPKTEQEYIRQNFVTRFNFSSGQNKVILTVRGQKGWNHTLALRGWLFETPSGTWAHQNEWINKSSMGSKVQSSRIDSKNLPLEFSFRSM